MRATHYRTPGGISDNGMHVYNVGTVNKIIKCAGLQVKCARWFDRSLAPDRSFPLVSPIRGENLDSESAQA